jgi:hypothetical protein
MTLPRESDSVAFNARFVLIAIATIGVVSITSRQADAGGAWLSRLNKYRAEAKLGLLREDEPLSEGDAAHARYLVENFSEQVRAKQPLGVNLHLEESGRPGFTYAGFIAGRASDVLIYNLVSSTPMQTWAIDAWVIAPFHRLPLLDPSLRRVGYGEFCTDQICAAAINHSSDSASPDLMFRRRLSSGIPMTGQSDALGGGWGTRFAVPVEFPANGSAIELGQFGKGEWPDPLTSCPGYSYPVGVPITLQTGRFLTPRITSWSLSSAGSGIEACTFDSQNYNSPDELTGKIGRRDLEAFGAVMLIPRTPLKAGARYDVTMRVDDITYSWSFSISPAARD